MPFLVPVASLDHVWKYEDCCQVYVLQKDDQALLIDLGSGRVLDHLTEIGVRQVAGVYFTHAHRDQCQGAERALALGIPLHFPASAASFLDPAQRPDFTQVTPFLWSYPGKFDYPRPFTTPIPGPSPAPQGKGEKGREGEGRGPEWVPSPAGRGRVRVGVGKAEATPIPGPSPAPQGKGGKELDQVIRGLVTARRGDGWSSTRDTAQVLFALTDYLKGSTELRPHYSAAVQLNGQPVRSLPFTPAEAFSPGVTLDLPPEELSAGENRFTFRKRGPGALYYTATLTYYQPAEPLPAQAAGLQVQRRYFRYRQGRNVDTGLMEYLSLRPHGAFQPGDLLRVELILTAPQDREYVLLEDPLPAGCEVVGRPTEDSDEEAWWAEEDVRDDHIAFFFRDLQRGRQTLSYLLRAELPGDYHVLPPRAEAMYQPDCWGQGEEGRVRIVE